VQRAWEDYVLALTPEINAITNLVSVDGLPVGEIVAVIATPASSDHRVRFGQALQGAAVSRVYVEHREPLARDAPEIASGIQVSP
jgi:hypothetical protein